MMAFQVILLSLSSNLDNLGFGMAMGLKARMTVWVAVIVGAMSGVMMAVGMAAGGQVATLLPPENIKWIAGGIYLVLAVFFTVDEIRGKNQQKPRKEKWTVGAALLIGVALGIDSLGIGISAGMTGYPALTPVVAGGVSIALIFLGSYFVKNLRFKFVREKAGFISAMLLVLIALRTIL